MSRSDDDGGTVAARLDATTRRSILNVADLQVGFETPTGFSRVVVDVAFDVRKGSITGLVGESGSGKSTVVRSVLGLTRSPGKVLAGRAMFGDVDLLGLTQSQLRRIRGARITFIAQNPFAVLNPVLTIGAQFRNLIGAHAKMSRARADSLTRQRLTDVGLGAERVMSAYAHELSGGMAQRVVIAMALVLDPELVIADEPTTALDVTVQRQVLDLIHRLVRTGAQSLLLVTHDLGIVAQYCDDVIVMFDGAVVEAGPVDQVLIAPTHAYTQGLVAASRRSALTRS